MSDQEHVISSEDEYLSDSDGDDNASVIIISSNERTSYADNRSSSNHSDPNIDNDISDHNSLNILDIEDESVTEDNLDNEDNGDSWSNLPSLSVEKIYSFLSRTDQYRMSLVCRRWCKDYSSPSLWKTIKFYLPEYDYSSEIYPEIRFARKYGAMFRHVEVICKRVRAQLLGVIWKQLKLFLQTLSDQSQLQSIKFINMGNYFRYLDDFIHHDIFRVIVNFFRSQRNLARVDIVDSRFTREEGVEVLKVLTESSGGTLKSLQLRGFVLDTVTFEESPEYAADLWNILNRLLCIRTLDIEYTKVFEDMLRTCPENSDEAVQSSTNDTKRSLSYLNIYCEGSRQPGYRGVSPNSWKYLKRACLDLKVSLDLTLSIHARAEINRYISRFMPLQTLELRLDKPSVSPRTDISVLFNHLIDCKCNDHLEVVNVIWVPSINDLAVALIPFLQACQKLRTIQIHARYCTGSIENILKSLMENRPKSLRSFTLWFNEVRNEADENDLTALSEEYYPLLQLMGIEVFLLVDPGRRLRRRPPI